MSNIINVGLIGYGIAGQVFHAPMITAVPHLHLAKVVERHSQNAGQRYPHVEVVRTAAEVWGDESIELVVIATPNSSHFALAQEALLAGKHVVIDKPFTTTAAEATQLTALAKQQNRLLSVHHNRRWDGDFLTVRQLLQSGLLGRLVRYEAHFDRFRNALRPNAWREAEGPGSGLLFDLGSHLIDQALCLFGLPQAVTAVITTQRDGGQTDDAFHLLLHYDRLQVILQAGMLVRELGPRFALHGTEGSFVKFGLDPQEEALRRGESPAHNPQWGSEAPAQWGTLNTQVGGLHVRGQVETLRGDYRAYYQNIYEAIAGQAALAVTPEEACHTMRLLECAVQSAAQQRTLPFEPVAEPVEAIAKE